MKNTLLFLIGIVFITSCSEQKFAFRKKIRVGAPEIASKERPKRETIEQLAIKKNAQDTVLLEEETPSIEGEALASNDKLTLQDQSTIKPWKQPQRSNSVKIKPGTKEEFKTFRMGWAIASFVFAVLGLFAPPFLLVFLLGIAAILCGLVGVTSSLRWLAIMGIVVGAIDLFLLILLIATQY